MILSLYGLVLGRGFKNPGIGEMQNNLLLLKLILILSLLSGSFIGSIANAKTLPKLAPVSIAVIDFRGVLTKSEAAIGIRKSIDARRAEYRKKFAKIEKQLRERQQILADQRAVITSESFDQRARALKDKARLAQRQAQEHNQLLKRSFDKSMEKVQKMLFRVVAEVAEESGAKVVLFRRSIVIAVKELEISQEVLARLNSRLPKVVVKFAAETK